MASPHRFGFDPDTPGAQRLLRANRRAKPVEIEITEGLYVHAGRAYGPGDRPVIARDVG